MCILIFTRVLQRVHTDFVEVSKDLSRSESNFVGPKWLYRKLERCSKKFWHSSNQFERPT